MRAFRLITLVVLLVVSLTPVRADNVSDFYNLWTENTKKALQEDLYWAGYDPGPIDGDIGLSSLAALRSFQFQNGEYASGILSDRLNRALVTRAEAEKRKLGYRYVVDPATGASIGIPFGFMAKQTPTQKGTRYYSADGSMEVETFAISTGETLQSLYDKLSHRPNRAVSYSPLRETWFVLKGMDAAPGLSRNEFYIRAHSDGRQLRGFSISYAPGRYPDVDRLLTVMSFTFDPFPSEHNGSMAANTGQGGPLSIDAPRLGVQSGLYTIKANDGYLNLRQGPGTNYDLITKLPNGSSVSISVCQRSQAPQELPFCKAQWHEYTGWVSSCCIIVSGVNPSLSAPEDSPDLTARGGPPARSDDRTVIPLKNDGGTYEVPVLINGAIPLDFIVDSGASDVSIPADVVLTLMRMKTITDEDFIGRKTYRLADGRTVPSTNVRIRSLKVGDKVLENVTASVASVEGALLLGQSFLSRFNSWSINNTTHELVLE